MQRVVLDPVPPMSDESTELVLGPHVVLSCAATEGVPMFERCPPVHSVLLGHCRVEIGERVHSSRAVAVPANTPHRVVGFEEPVAGVAYLDPRRYTFDDVQGLAAKWRELVPGRDDLRDAYRDALAPSPRQVDRRLLRALDAMESGGATVAEAAAGVDLSISRLTHLMTETLGAPPRTWRAWFKLRAAVGHTLRTGASLTEAAHDAGFADSAHLTRTAKQLMGVRPAMMLPRAIYIATETALPES